MTTSGTDGFAWFGRFGVDEGLCRAAFDKALCRGADFAELYTIVDRENMVVIRDPFSSKSTGLVDYLFERRVGGQVVNAAAGRYLQCKV